MTLKGYRSRSQSCDSKYIENGDRYEVRPQGALIWKQPCAFDWYRQIWPSMTLKSQKSRSHFWRETCQERQELRCWTYGLHFGWPWQVKRQGHERASDGDRHGRRSVGGQGNISPYFFEVEGTPCGFCSPSFSGVDIFVLMQTVLIGWLEQFSLNIVS